MARLIYALVPQALNQEAQPVPNSYLKEIHTTLAQFSERFADVKLPSMKDCEARSFKGVQHRLSIRIMEDKLAHFMSSHADDNSLLGRLRSCSGYLSGSFLFASVSFAPNRFSDWSFRGAVALRFGCPTTSIRSLSSTLAGGELTTCRKCGTPNITVDDSHALTCKRSTRLVIERHNNLRDYMSRVLISAGFISVECEKPNLDGGISDIRCIDPVSDKTVHFDVTVVHPLSESRRNSCPSRKHCDTAETGKIQAYQITSADPACEFFPLGAEVYGSIGSNFQSVLQLCASRVVEKLKFSMSASERGKRQIALVQMWSRSISVILQRFNMSIIGTFVRQYRESSSRSTRKNRDSKNERLVAVACEQVNYGS